MKAKQIDKGYSLIYLFAGSSSNYDKSKQLAKSSDLALTYGAGWEDVSISLTFNVDALSSDYFWICYNASGNFDDDWKIKELKLSIKYCCA